MARKVTASKPLVFHKIQLWAVIVQREHGIQGKREHGVQGKEAQNSGEKRTHGIQGKR